MQKSIARVGQLHVEYSLLGVGQSNIIFLNGFRMPLENWEQIYPALITNHKVLLYNRFGVGGSSKAKVSQNGHQVVADLRSLLFELQLQPPYVLVGHSLGGLFAQLYTTQFPKEVIGLVLVDSPHPEEIALQKKQKPPFLLHLLNEHLKRLEKLKDPFKYSEDESIDQTIIELLHHTFPNIPVAIISGAQKMPFVPKAAFELHQRYQIELLKLSPQATHFECLSSGHFPQLTEPQKVIQAILELVKRSDQQKL